MKKVRVERMGETYGTIEVTPDGLKLEGNRQRLAEFIAAATMGDDPADAPGGLGGFLSYLTSPSVSNGYTMVVPVAADGDGEPQLTDDEELARLAALETAWDRPDVKLLMEQRDLAARDREEAERFWDRPDVREILEQWNPYAGIDGDDGEE